jgi:hypothetical protein
MATASLDNLVRGGQLKAEPPAQSELDGLIRSGLARLKDAENQIDGCGGEIGYRGGNATDEELKSVIEEVRRLMAELPELFAAEEYQCDTVSRSATASRCPPA